MRGQRSLGCRGWPRPVFHVHALLLILSGGSGDNFPLEEGRCLQITGAYDPLFSYLEKNQWQSPGHLTVLPKPTCSSHLNDRTTSSQEAPFGEPLYPCQAQHRLQLIYLGLSCSLTRLLVVARQLWEQQCVLGIN